MIILLYIFFKGRNSVWNFFSANLQNSLFAKNSNGNFHVLEYAICACSVDLKLPNTWHWSCASKLFIFIWQRKSYRHIFQNTLKSRTNNKKVHTLINYRYIFGLCTTIAGTATVGQFFQNLLHCHIPLEVHPINLSCRSLCVTIIRKFTDPGLSATKSHKKCHTSQYMAKLNLNEPAKVYLCCKNVLFSCQFFVIKTINYLTIFSPSLFKCTIIRLCKTATGIVVVDPRFADLGRNMYSSWFHSSRSRIGRGLGKKHET